VALLLSSRLSSHHWCTRNR